MGYEPRRCPICGDPKTEMKEGREVFKRCYCEWEKGFHVRLARTVFKTYYEPKMKRMSDWKPPIYFPAKAGLFPSFIRMQKVVAVHRLWDYCYKDVGVGTWSALLRSVDEGRNLFVRGPKGSGRGLISACIKFVAAKMDISATPLPGDFDLFKNEILESKALGREGAEAKALVSEKYADVRLLVLEGCRAESIIKFSGEETPVKFRGSNEIDSLLARRQMTRGGMLLTSDDFIGQVSNTMGDRLLEVLASDDTRLVLMLSVDEANDLLAAVASKQKAMAEWVAAMGAFKAEKGPERKTAPEKMSEKGEFRMVEEALFFEDAFPNIPSDTLTGNRVGVMLDVGDGFPPCILSTYAAFKESRERKGAEYKEGIRAARVAAVRSCKSLASMMIEKEMEEVGRILSLAAGPQDRMDELAREATRMRAAMSAAPTREKGGNERAS